MWQCDKYYVWQDGEKEDDEKDDDSEQEEQDGDISAEEGEDPADKTKLLSKDFIGKNLGGKSRSLVSCLYNTRLIRIVRLYMINYLGKTLQGSRHLELFFDVGLSSYQTDLDYMRDLMGLLMHSRKCLSNTVH